MAQRVRRSSPALAALAAAVLLLPASLALSPVPSLYDANYELRDIYGKKRTTGEFRGKVTLVVNVASQCGYTDANYRGLQELYSRYRSQGLEILAFPCNQFGQQEPGSDAEIAAFARERYGAAFPLFSKVEVNGEGQAPIFRFLKAAAPGAPGGQRGEDVGWNFVKWLVDRQGRPVKRYAWDFPRIEIDRDVQQLLAEQPSGGGDADAEL